MGPSFGFHVNLREGTDHYFLGMSEPKGLAPLWCAGFVSRGQTRLSQASTGTALPDALPDSVVKHAAVQAGFGACEIRPGLNIIVEFHGQIL